MPLLFKLFFSSRLSIGEPSRGSRHSPKEGAGTPGACPQRMENYELFRSLRDTLYGKVRYGRDRRTGEIVMVKEFYLECVENRVSVNGHPIAEDAMEEIKIHAELEKGKHANIVGLRGVYRDSKKMYVILEYCSNGDFFNHVQQSKFSEEVAKHFFRHLIEGVEYMHSRGYAHRDLSLENVLMDEKKNLKICDFGLSIRADAKSQKRVDPDRRPGKIKYMPPEIFSVQDYNPCAADLYCCGVMLFVMLIGTFPYELPQEDDERFKLVINGHLNHLLKIWKLDDVISNDAKDLLCKLLAYEDKRISLQEVKNHPWLKDKKSTSSKPPPKMPAWFSKAPPAVRNKIQQLIVKVLLQYVRQPNQEFLVTLANELQQRYEMSPQQTREIIVYFHERLKAEAAAEGKK